MSEKSVARIERRLRFRRRRHNEKAVSPVVATLILILIAVAAAAALYLWLTGWQAGITKSIGTPVIPSNLKFSIGGSTTVYPLSQLGIKWFEQNNTNTNITDQQGGSVAGAEAYCAGQVDVGAASTSFTTSQLTGDGCSAALAANTVQNVVGVDGLVGIVSKLNTGIGSGAGLVPAANVSFNASTMYAIYAAASTSVPVTNTGNYPGQVGSYTLPSWLCGSVAVAAGDTHYGTCAHMGVSAGGGVGINWSVIPFPAGCSVTVATPGVANGCYFGTMNNARTNTYDRLDAGGTEQGFTQKNLAIPKDGSQNSCGTDNQLESCHITATHHENGNPALAAAVAADPNGIGFNSFGQANAQANLIVAGYQGTSIVGQTQQAFPILPTISGVLGAYKGTVATASAYVPWRVLEYLTDGTPAAGSIEAQYLTFVLGPDVNQNLGEATGYISLYAA